MTYTMVAGTIIVLAVLIYVAFFAPRPVDGGDQE